jgi:molybdenum-dependent DNA-binding transcriptional regulator ModE
MMTPEVITALAGAVTATIGAVVGGRRGGKTGGESSLNGFKEEVRQSFLGIHVKLDVLTKTDGEHEARLKNVEYMSERRTSEDVPRFLLEERRES